MKTPITYYGGKITLLSKILPLIPKHRIYTESFFGGGAVFFAKVPSESEIINDTNNMVINFYEVCKTDFEKLKTKIQATLFSRATYTVALTMYKMPHLFSRLQQAWAFYIATNMGFACKIGSWGFDKYGKRLKTVQNKKIRFDEDIPKRLLNTLIENNGACKVIEIYDDIDAFHYVDPPYFNADMGHYDGYTEVDYRKLLETLSNIKGKFLLSSYPSDILDEFIKKNGWYTKTIDKPLVASNGANVAKRKRKIEVLTANYSI
ncbi:DNA adenine methylase [Kordia sp. YSTF-M3]|uniref:DNA adenine methylase n=1 Tax=Kordia aestuariivivens TaxID=2759037 RepID=A0ABR7QFH8_9FLAO|nr:DNA adenine methylase [Kordia aestuariivivens]MBC8757299.1 DNA adenine methylase [Kordia aestuariivivens]